MRAIKRLYDSVGPNPQIVRWAILEKNLNIDVHVLGLNKEGYPENRTNDMLKKNPSGTTPFVELDDGTVIAETFAICQYLDRISPSHPFLTGDPKDPVMHAKTTMWIDRIKLQIVAPYQRQFQYGEGLPYFKAHVPWAEESSPSVSGLRKQVIDNLIWLEQIMASEEDDRTYIAGGENLSYADMSLYSTLQFMANPKVNIAKRTQPFDPLSTHVMDEEKFPWLNRWFKNLSLSPHANASSKPMRKK
jgi:glutathione S-transferase